jgi:hypothetical protein
MRLACSTAALHVLLYALGCGGEPRSSAASELSQARAEAPAAGPDMPHPGRDELEAMLDYKAKVYANGLLAEDPPSLGELAEGERRDLLAVLKGGYCYRVLGVAGSGVQDMDLMLFDPDGMQTHQDPGQDPYPMLGLQAAICPATAGSFRIQVHMYKGGGRYAVRVFRTPQ